MKGKIQLQRRDITPHACMAERKQCYGKTDRKSNRVGEADPRRRGDDGRGGG